MLGQWIGEQIRGAKLDELRQMSVADLRRLWDEIGDDSFSNGYDCADIHSYMNMLGDGVYCAV